MSADIEKPPLHLVTQTFQNGNVRYKEVLTCRHGVTDAFQKPGQGWAPALCQGVHGIAHTTGPQAAEFKR